MLSQLKLEDCIGHTLVNAVHLEDDECLLLIFPHGYYAVHAYAHGHVECEHLDEMEQSQVLQHFQDQVLVDAGFISENEFKQIRDTQKRQAEERQRLREYEQYLRLKAKFSTGDQKR